MVVYDNINNYDNYRNIYHRFNEVVESRTKYTIQINFGKKKVILNNSNNDEIETNILNLISKVKKDTENFLSGVEVNTEIISNDIYWYVFNHEIEDSIENFEVAKIDLTSAYWTKALNLGIITKQTNEYFNSINFKNVSEKKKARLKAFGSLATIKSVNFFEKGVKNWDRETLKVNDKFRAVYLYVCDCVAKDMLAVLGSVGGYYYYWDCLFVDLDKITTVAKIFKNLGYNFTVEKEIANIFLDEEISYFECTKTDKNGKIKIIKYPIN